MLTPVQSSTQRVRSHFDRLKDLLENPEIRSHWSRYLCVLTAGLLENSLREILNEYVRIHADKRVRNRFSSRQERNPNPNRERIISTLGDFDKTWERNICSFLSGENGAIVDSVMNNRNQISHGGDVGLTPTTMERHFECVVCVIAHIDELVLNGPQEA